MMHKEIGRFLVVGSLSTIVNYGVFALLHLWMQQPYLIASAAGYITGLVLGYGLNRYWTFAHAKANATERQAMQREILLYLLVYMSSLVISLVVLEQLVQWAHIPATISNVLAIGVSTAMNFIGLRIVVFNKQ